MCRALALQVFQIPTSLKNGVPRNPPPAVPGNPNTSSQTSASVWSLLEMSPRETETENHQEGLLAS